MSEPQPLSHPFAAFFDLDGTLAINNGAPSGADRDAIRAFRRQGNFAFLCTGRAPAFLYPAVLDIGFDGIVAGAGHTLHWETGSCTGASSEQTIRNVADFSARTGDVCILEGETGMFQVDIRGHSRYPWATIVSGDDFFARYPA